MEISFLLILVDLIVVIREHTLSKLVEVAKKHKVKKILIEENFGQGMFSELLKPYLIKNINVLQSLLDSNLISIDVY